MKIVSYNIRYGLGLDGKYDLKRIADSIGEADIIALQEVERFWRRSGMVDQTELLGNLLPDYYWAYCPAFDIDASERRQDNSILNRRRQFGTMLLSKWPIIATRCIVFPQLGSKQMFNMATGAIEGLVASPIGSLQIYSLHLSALSSRERLLQIDTFLAGHAQSRRSGGIWTGNGEYADPVETANYINGDWSNGDELPPEPEHTLIMGDFNCTVESAEYIRFAGEIDPVYGRGLHSEDLLDSWNVAKNQIGEANTWWPDPPQRAPAIPIRLDYCFVSSGLSSRISKAWVDSNARGSDHKPYWVEIDE